MSAQSIADDVTLSYAAKIDKLLRKAESTNSEDEAEALTAKAEELMVTHGVTELLLAVARGKLTPEKIVERQIKHTGIYRIVLVDISFAVARNNDCRGLQSHVTWGRPPYMAFYYIGFESDVERAMLLDASLQIQCARAMRRWWKSEDRGWMSGMQGYKARREFIVGFASGVRSKLAAANRAGREAAIKEHANETGATEDEVKETTALVLRSRRGQVDDWMDRRYGSSLRSTSRRYQSGGWSAHSAGHEAGKAANLGQPSVTRNKAIGGR